MKRLRLAGVLAACLILSWTATGAADDCRLRVGYEPYGAYTYTDAEGNPAGIDIDVIRAFSAELGCETSFAEMPWTRILLMIENGELDATSSASLTPERLRFARFSVPYRKAEVAIFVRRGESARFPLGRLSDVPKAGLRLGTIAGYHYGAEFEALRQDPAFARQIDYAVDYETNIRKLLHHHIDGFIVDDAGVMQSVLKSLGSDDRVERHPLALPAEDLHFMTGRRSVAPELVEAIDRVLLEMAADGRLQGIMRNHLD